MTVSLIWYRVAAGKGKTATGLSGTRWTVKGPILGRQAFWLYRNGSRQGLQMFTSEAAAQREAERLESALEATR